MFALGGYTRALRIKDLVYAPFLIFFFISITFVISRAVSVGSDLDMLKKRERAFDDILHQFNKEKFMKKNCRLDVGDYGAWIELSLFKKNKKLEEHILQKKKEVEREIMDELADQLYSNGILPMGRKDWTGL